MQFGHLSDISGVDFTLPPDHPSNKQWLPGKPPGEPLRIWLGVPRWNIPVWQGTLYPKGTKDTLSQYIRLLSGIELNTTHYRIPDIARIQQWKEKANGRSFLFSPKVPQAISHRKNWLGNSDYTKLFFDTMFGLEEHLGHSFMQLPPYATAERLPELLAFIQQKPKSFLLGVELRHPSWFAADSSRPLFEAMHKHKVIPVFSAVSGRRDVLHMAVPTTTVMLRFVGNNLHPTDYGRIDNWVTRLQDWYQLGVEQAYVFIHQHDDQHLQATLNYFVAQVNERLGLSLPLVQPTGQTGSLF